MTMNGGPESAAAGLNGGDEPSPQKGDASVHGSSHSLAAMSAASLSPSLEHLADPANRAPSPSTVWMKEQASAAQDKLKRARLANAKARKKLGRAASLGGGHGRGSSGGTYEPPPKLSNSRRRLWDSDTAPRSASLPRIMTRTSSSRLSVFNPNHVYLRDPRPIASSHSQLMEGLERELATHRSDKLKLSSSLQNMHEIQASSLQRKREQARKRREARQQQTHDERDENDGS